MAIVKLITTLFIQLDFWDNVRDFVLSPFSDPKIERAITILLIPFFVNVSYNWPPFTYTQIAIKLLATFSTRCWYFGWPITFSCDTIASIKPPIIIHHRSQIYCNAYEFGIDQYVKARTMNRNQKLSYLVTMMFCYHRMVPKDRNELA